jgi:hypothetical protein
VRTALSLFASSSSSSSEARFLAAVTLDWRKTQGRKRRKHVELVLKGADALMISVRLPPSPPLFLGNLHHYRRHFCYCHYAYSLLLEGKKKESNFWLLFWLLFLLLL